MATSFGEPGARRWRSRASVQPLIVTVLGAVASVVLYVAASWFANGPLGGQCTYGPDACGYVWMGSIWRAVVLLPVLVVGQLVTGFVVGISTQDSGLALPAVLVGVMLPLVVVVTTFVLPGLLMSGRADAIALNLAGAVLIGLVVLVPVAFGYGVGRLVRPSPADPDPSTKRCGRCGQVLARIGKNGAVSAKHRSPNSHQSNDEEQFRLNPCRVSDASARSRTRGVRARRCANGRNVSSDNAHPAGRRCPVPC